MKRRFWAELLILILVLCLSLSGCKSSSGSDYDQIVKASIDLAQTYVELKEYDKACEVYESALSKVDNYMLSYNYALLQFENGNLKEAIDIAELGFEKFPEKVEFLKLEVEIFKSLNDFENAESTLLRILESDEQDRTTRFDLIELYKNENELEKAYDMALVMWEQLYLDKETVEVLYSIHPELWVNVYNYLAK